MSNFNHYVIYNPTTPALGQHVNEEDFLVYIGHDRIEKI